MKSPVCVVLGGGGAFGIHVSRSFLRLDPSVFVVGAGRNPLRPEPFRMGINRETRYVYKQFHVGHDFDFLTEFLSLHRPSVIVNFAAQGEGAASWRHSWRFFDTNATALAHLYEWVSAQEWAPSTHFIHVGTSELYGSVKAPAREDAPIRPSSPYAASKAAFDLYLLAMAQQGRGARATILRPSNCYCSGQLLHRVIPRAIVAGLTGRKLPLHGGGRAKKSYMHAFDLGDAIYRVAVSSVNDVPHGTVFNLGPEMPVSIEDVVRECADAVGVAFEDLVAVVDERVGQDGQYWLDSTAARRTLGWTPVVSLGEGVREVCEWAQANLDALRLIPAEYELRS